MTTDLNALAQQTVKQLTQRWSTLGVPGDPPHLKHALVRGIAWYIQTMTSCDIDADTRRLLKSAIRYAPSPKSMSKPPSRRTQRDGVKLRTGTTLIRTWRGRKHEVTVFRDGKAFLFRDTEYASLSEVARVITGARWSGPRFFGLKKLKGKT